MTYPDIKNIETKINNDIKKLKFHSERKHFLEAHFYQWLVSGDYNDDSSDPGYKHDMLKEIEADKRFIAKLYFVLNRYVKSS